ncbi:hypothetical protein BDB01DRAFT_902960 [Pilobolus umbonatus]|nr:hypothetical protein BDB01DRAFT_902960 [Pilobolus umbonatus]
MSKPFSRRMIQSPFLLVSSVIAITGWIITFISGCKINVLKGAWWIVIYELVIIIGHLIVFSLGTAHNHRIACVAFLASSIPLLTIQIDYVVQNDKPSLQKLYIHAYGVGYAIILIIQYSWILVLGSDKETFLGRLGYLPEEEKCLLKSQCSRIFTEGNLVDMSSALNRLNRPIYPESSDRAFMRESIVEYKIKVQALHEYEGCAQDPNELSFEKGEIMDIIDNKGNWWQARKHNGSIGIIPSNYAGMNTQAIFIE